MDRNRWIILISIFVIAGRTACGSEDGSEDENGQSSNNGQAGGTPFVYQCPEGTDQHTTSSGKTICCPSNNSQFCDENAEGYEGGCWPEGTDCDAITWCGDQYAACPPESLPYCNNGQLQCFECSEGSSVYHTASGKPFCCDADFPTFCDENSQGYEGGCWQAEVDCQTIAQCGGTWTACPSGLIVFCDEATGQNFCVQS